MADGAFDEEHVEERRGFARVRTNVVLFVLTVVSVFFTGAEIARGWAFQTSRTSSSAPPPSIDSPFDVAFLLNGWTFAVPLLLILLTHEFGHYFAARYHRVPASLPYFIPLPLLSPFGTMGAVIGMNDRIRSRAALLDIGAAGPLAGMVVALPVLVWGIAQSTISPPPEPPYWLEGQSVLYWFLKRIIHGPIPPGYDMNMHPTAFAGWAGLFVTMLNLIPFGQLDGGHIAYALFGKKQDRFAAWVRRSLLLLFAYNLLVFLGPIALGKSELSVSSAIGNSLTWIVWYALLGLLSRLGGREHPPFEPGPLSPARRFIAWFCLFLFLVIFMPTPLAVIG